MCYLFYNKIINSRYKKTIDLSTYGASKMKVMNYGLKKEFLDRYDVDAVLKENHLTAEQIVEDVLSIL